MIRKVSSLTSAIILCMMVNATDSSANPIIISESKVTIAHARDIFPDELLPKAGDDGGFVTAADAEAARNEPVFVVEFLSNADLRQLAKEFKTRLSGNVYSCSKDSDTEPTFNADVVTDKFGWILPQGFRLPGPPQFAAPAGRYLLYVSKDSTEALNLLASGQPVPANARLETLAEDVCITIEAYDFDHPFARSEVMRVPHIALQAAWKAFVASGGLQKPQ